MSTGVNLPDDLIADLQSEAQRAHQSVDDLLSELVRTGLDRRRRRTPVDVPLATEEITHFLTELRRIGAEAAEHSVDPRSAVEILQQDRR